MSWYWAEKEILVERDSGVKKVGLLHIRFLKCCFELLMKFAVRIITALKLYLKLYIAYII